MAIGCVRVPVVRGVGVLWEILVGMVIRVTSGH